MSSKLVLQPNPFLSRRLGRCLVVGATLSLPAFASAQPTERETVPQNPAFVQGRFTRNDPPIITTEELQALTGGPTLLNFTGTNVPASDVMKALKDASKTRPSFADQNNQNNDQTKISVSWINTPFWKAASQIEELLDGRWESEYRGALAFKKNYRTADKKQGVEPGLNGLVGGQTPFVAICANSLTRTSVSKIFMGAEQGPVQNSPDRRDLTMTSYFDPKLTIRSVELRDVKYQSKPNVASVENPQRYFGPSIPNQNNIITKSNLSIPEGVAAEKNFFRISGVVHAVISVGSETWKVPDLVAADKTPVTIAGGELNIENVDLKTNQLTIKIVAKMPPDQGMNYFGNPFGSIIVRDAQGNEIRQGGASSTGEGGKLNMEVRYNFQRVGNEGAAGPYSLEWVIPTQTRSYRVPFEFRDFPMP